MKHAYVSVVMPLAALPNDQDLRQVDAALQRVSRAHEIVLVVPFDRTETWEKVPVMHGPLTVVRVQPRTTLDSAAVAGLARAVGDFVIEWRGRPRELDESTINQLLEPTNRGCELVEALSPTTSSLSARFYTAANALRPPSQPIRKATGRMYSRNALGRLLSSTSFEPQLSILAAELPVERESLPIEYDMAELIPLRRRIAEGISLLSKGTRFGSVVPVLLAGVSASFGVAAALYAVLIIVFRGRAPEGWTTLMVVAGLGQAAILAMIGLVWSRIDSLTRGLSRDPDATSSVDTVAPTADAEDQGPP